MNAVNLRTRMLLAQVALPHLAGGGSSANIGSMEGISANSGLMRDGCGLWATARRLSANGRGSGAG